MVEVANTTNRDVFNTIGGNVTISGDVTFDLDLRTLTCISTDGPATTVTWTRDSTTVTEGNETVLNDAPTAKYTHTLSVSIGGEYKCTVANNKPSTTSASIVLEGERKFLVIVQRQFPVQKRKEKHEKQMKLSPRAMNPVSFTDWLPP